MSTNIYDLNYDYEQQNGTFMIISGIGDTGLHSDDLAKLQVNMVKSNEVDKLLPIVVEEIDFNVKFYYEITSKKMLSQALKEKELSIKQFYQLLYQIVSAMEASKEYMLHEHHFLLHEEFIFIGNNFQDIHLTYLPLAKIPQKHDLKVELRDLLFKLVGYVEELTGDGVQQLTKYLNDPSFNLADMKKKLRALQDQTNKGTEQAVSNSKQIIPISKPVVEDKPKSKPVQKPVGRGPGKIEQQKNTYDKRLSTPRKPTKQTHNRKTFGSFKVVVLCVALLIISVVWVLYILIPSQTMLYLSIGISLLSLTVSSYFAFVYKKVPNKVQRSAGSKVKANKQPVKRKKQQPKPVHGGITPKHVDEHQQVNAHQQVSATVDSKNYFENLRNQTSLFSQPDATVLLGEENEPSMNDAYIEISRNGSEEKKYLTQFPFVIGRNPSAVQYVEETVGVSRTHLEINQTNGRFTIKDLGSKNGSKLNGKAMVAYKLYDLEDQDVIKISKTEYTFNKG
ncbi:DUF6382 domain-containing protein [Aquibacillus rhizosphaerae]|uniref:DUF6382 domain-containing protein n=1 Tax=Aquibacillus rhizosphaerae TaxID=3051431 RepID=A0ABT7KZL8_9BACI|nr:DUF6382 domain-containing protein [Aquibacillus sp. LR5S19]MDL4838920.1 DUF6382 domain-containing protein [Aquibacillus sp. LR5S19]